jgi:hypothetical protein
MIPGPLLQHPRPLPDRQPGPWSLLDKPLKDTLGLGKAVPGEQQFFDAKPIPAPLLDLVEVAPVCEAGSSVSSWDQGSGISSDCELSGSTLHAEEWDIGD